MLDLKVPEVAAKYESTFVNDPIVHVCGGDGEGWRGKLSTIPLWAAEKLVEMKSNNLVLKTVTKTRATPKTSEALPKAQPTPTPDVINEGEGEVEVENKSDE